MNEPTSTTGGVGFSPADIRAHDQHDHLAAVFADRRDAVGAVDELRALGLGSEQLGIAVHGDDAVVFEHDADSELLHDTEVGALVGAPVGAIAGLAVAALAIPGIGVIGVGGMLTIAGASPGHLRCGVGCSAPTWEPRRVNREGPNTKKSPIPR